MAFKRKHYLLIFTLIGLFFYWYNNYFRLKRESTPVKIKTLSMSTEKRKMKPWTSILDQKEVTKKKSNLVQEPPLNEKTISELADFLESSLRDIASTNLKKLQKNIEIADEIIAREPGVYSAYKAKLMSMLIIEGKYNQTIDDKEVEILLEAMAQFDTKTEENARNEALLISKTTKELESATEELNDLALQEAIVSTDYEQNELFKKEEILVNEINRMQEKINRAISSEENYINEDIVQIPFLRMMAKNDYEQVIQDSEIFIENFPNSPYGHIFLINALYSSGQKEEALEILKNLPEEIQDKIQFYDQSYYTEYWKKLFF